MQVQLLASPLQRTYQPNLRSPYQNLLVTFQRLLRASRPECLRFAWWNNFNPTLALKERRLSRERKQRSQVSRCQCPWVPCLSAFRRLLPCIEFSLSLPISITSFLSSSQKYYITLRHDLRASLDTRQTSGQNPRTSAAPLCPFHMWQYFGDLMLF